MNLQLCTITLICVVFLFIQSTLSAPFKTYREIDYNPRIRHRVIKTPSKCDCHSEDLNLPEITFHNLESSNGKFIKRLLHLSEIHIDNMDSSPNRQSRLNQRNEKVYILPTLDDDNRMSALDPRLRQPLRSEKNEHTWLPALDPRLKPDQNDPNNQPALEDPKLPALDPRLKTDQSATNPNEDNSNNSLPPSTNNENPQQEAPVDPSEIPIPDRTKVEQIRTLIESNSNNPNSVLWQGKFPKTKQQILERVAAGRGVPRHLDDPATS